MLRGGMAALFLSIIALAAPPTPTELALSSEVHWDFGPPFWQIHLLILRQEADDIVIRAVEIQPFESDCLKSKLIKSTEIRARNSSLETFVEGRNPCGISEEEVANARKKLPHQLVFTSVERGIQVECASVMRHYTLDSIQMFSERKLSGRNPDLSGLWGLFDAAFRLASNSGPLFAAEPIFRVSPEANRGVQLNDRDFVADLRSGRYDGVLSAECEKRMSCSPRRFSDILADYSATLTYPVSLAKVRPIHHVRFTKFVEPTYAPVARLARITGTVWLEVKSDMSTGLITSTKVVSGHPMLAKTSDDAAMQWIVMPTEDSASFRVYVDYTQSCPVLPE